jgi:hypothetical protein
MPNGGSDCCGTCPFNRKNRGQAGYGDRDNPEPDHCDVRDLPIEHAAFWTYCANHPHHNPDLVRIPVGPVYVAAGVSYGREVWKPSPDTEEVRAEVHRLIATASPEPVTDYPSGLALVEAAILQAGEFRDPRYVPELDRIRQFPGIETEDHPDFARDPARSAALAVNALRLVLPPEAIRPFVNETVKAIAGGIAQTGDPSGLAVLADALQEAGCSHAPTLDYLRSPAARHPSWVVDVILDRVPPPE